MKYGLNSLIKKAEAKKSNSKNKEFYNAVIITFKAAIKLAERYSSLARKMAEKSSGLRKRELELIAEACKKIPKYGCRFGE